MLAIVNESSNTREGVQFIVWVPHLEGARISYTFFFISTPFFSAQPGVAYHEAVFEPQMCLDVCLTYHRTFIYEIIKKVQLNPAIPDPRITEIRQ